MKVQKVSKNTIGIDEVGRGPIAGPVCVCAFLAKHTPDLRKLKVESPKLKGKKIPLRDSKKLTQTQRELWFSQIKIWQKEGKCDFAVTMVSAKIIDKIGISKAIQKALDRSLGILLPNFRHGGSSVKIFLDGGLHAPVDFKNQKTIIKGDEKIPVISLASIVAKVTRDRYMQTIAKKFPQYGFETHVGYGTKNHYANIRKHGMQNIHRKSFLKNFDNNLS